MAGKITILVSAFKEFIVFYKEYAPLFLLHTYI